MNGNREKKKRLVPCRVGPGQNYVFGKIFQPRGKGRPGDSTNADQRKAAYLVGSCYRDNGGAAVTFGNGQDRDSRQAHKK